MPLQPQVVYTNLGDIRHALQGVSDDSAAQAMTDEDVVILLQVLGSEG